MGWTKVEGGERWTMYGSENERIMKAETGCVQALKDVPLKDILKK